MPETAFYNFAVREERKDNGGIGVVGNKTRDRRGRKSSRPRYPSCTYTLPTLDTYQEECPSSRCVSYWYYEDEQITQSSDIFNFVAGIMGMDLHSCLPSRATRRVTRRHTAYTFRLPAFQRVQVQPRLPMKYSVF